MHRQRQRRVGRLHLDQRLSAQAKDQRSLFADCAERALLPEYKVELANNAAASVRCGTLLDVQRCLPQLSGPGCSSQIVVVNDGCPSEFGDVIR